MGAEVLLRSSHPELGEVSPGEFIPIAESSGPITAIGEWLLRMSLQQWELCLDAGMAPLTLAVNLPAVQFRQHKLPAVVACILEECGVPAGCLEPELTDSVASEEPEEAMAMMNKLSSRGRPALADPLLTFTTQSCAARKRACVCCTG